MSRVRLYAVVFAVLAMATTGASSQQEIELRLETPPAVAPVTEQAPPITESFGVPSRIEAVMRGKAPAITGESAILVDAETGQVLFERNAFTKRPIASTTKIMTAVLALERSNLNDVVVASKAVSEIPYTSLHLKQGERIPMRDLLTGMLLRSANDAAVAVAEHVSGSVPAFAKLMNAKAKEIGAKNTHFVNPNGLYDPDHYSSAYDLSLFARYALQMPVFNEIVRMRRATLNRSMNTEDAVVFNKSQFVRNYPGADGVKSGYIREAGNCFVGSATRGDWRLISVVLKSHNANKDTATLMDYGFSNFKRVVLVPKGKSFRSGKIVGAGRMPALTENSLWAVLPVGDNSSKLGAKLSYSSASVPVRRGQTLGHVTAYMDGMPVGAVRLVAGRDLTPRMAAATSPWFWLRNCFILVCMGVVIRYGGAAAKGSFLGRSRLAQEIRRTYRLR